MIHGKIALQPGAGRRLIPAKEFSVIKPGVDRGRKSVSACSMPGFLLSGIEVNQVQVFSFAVAVDAVVLVRSVMHADGPWFVAADVCAALGISDVRQAVDRLDEAERGGCTVPTPGGMQEVRAVNESGMYALIFTSRRPEAQQFRRWVTSEVLPAIRKTGGYQHTEKQSAAVEAMAVADALCKLLRLEGSARLGVASKAMELTAPHLLPMVPAYAIDAPTGSTAASSEATAALTTLLKRHGHKVSAAACNIALRDLGIIEAKSRPSSKGGTVFFWSLTEAGLKYGKNMSSPKNQRETQPHWYEATFQDLARLLRL